MKKIIYAGAFLFLGTMALSSCKKDYQCKISVTVNGQTSSVSTDFNDLSKSDAKDKQKTCEDGGGTWSTK